METAIKTTDPDRWARYLLRKEIMSEMDQKSTSEIMGKSDDTSEKGSDWRGYMDEGRNRIGGGTGMGRPFTASCEGAMASTTPSLSRRTRRAQRPLFDASWWYRT